MTLTFLDQIAAWDERAFFWIHQEGTHPWLDTWMPWLTEMHRSTWGWLWIALFTLGLLQALGLWRWLECLLLTGAAIGLADSISHYLIKAHVMRVRPQELLGVSLKTFPHAGWSFPSNHAANNMALAVILSAFFPRFRLGFLLWALLIAWSRVYVGVHYPGDVVAGAALGGLCAVLILKIRNLARPFR